MQAGGREPAAFLECEDGRPIELPLVQPYLLARLDGACALLDSNCRCAAYEQRPDACRQYPHQVLLVDLADGRPVAAGPGPLATLAGGASRPGDAVPLLLRHRECPGFTGPPPSEAGWLEILRATATLQYGPPGRAGRAGTPAVG